jgi:BASS family bile acid:Na+ symporter
MDDTLMILVKISVVIFMAGNLLDMGLRLDPQDAARGLRDFRFVALTLVWGFVLAPALAYVIAHHVLPLEEHYAVGLVLMGMAPCAPFVPALVAKGEGDLGYTAAFMLLAAVGTVIFMPLAVPLMVKGLTITTWTVAKPLLVVVLLPLVSGMAILRASASFAGKLRPIVNKATGIATLAVAVLFVVVYGKGLLSVAGSFAVAAQLLFFAIVATLSYWVPFGMPHEQKIVLSVGMTPRNIGAAMAPLLSVPGMDERAVVMVVLGLPIMVLFALFAAKRFGRRASKKGQGGDTLSAKAG